MALLSGSPVIPALAVEDLDRTVGFYRDKPVLQDEDIGAPSGRYLRAGSDTSIYLYKSSFKRGETTVAGSVVNDPAKTVEELRGRGVVFEEYDLPGLKTEKGIASALDVRSA